MKNPMTLAGIEQATFRSVVQHLNHCATLRDAVRTFIHALGTFPPTLRHVVIKAKGGLRQKLHRAIKHTLNVFKNFYNNCHGFEISKQKQLYAVSPHLQNHGTDVITFCSGDSDTD